MFFIRIKKLSNAIKVSSLIFKEGSISKLAIAQKLNISLDEVDVRVEFLENHSYIPKCTITDGVIETDEYRMKKYEKNKVNKEVVQKELSQEKTSGECSNCGARVVFEGNSTLCPYCDTVIKSEK